MVTDFGQIQFMYNCASNCMELAFTNNVFWSVSGDTKTSYQYSVYERQAPRQSGTYISVRTLRLLFTDICQCTAVSVQHEIRVTYSFSLHVQFQSIYHQHSRGRATGFNQGFLPS